MPGTNAVAYFAAAFVRMKKSLYSFYQGVAGFEPTISGSAIDCSAPCGKVNKARVFVPGKLFQPGLILGIRQFCNISFKIKNRALLFHQVAAGILLLFLNLDILKLRKIFVSRQLYKQKR